MQPDEPHDSREEFEQALRDQANHKYVLRLFVAGNSARSSNAIANIREICETNLKGRYTLEVIDIYQQPEKARSDQILATPTLIKTLPPPLRRIIGDLSSNERVIVGLDLEKLDAGRADDRQPAENSPDAE